VILLSAVRPTEGFLGADTELSKLTLLLIGVVVSIAVASLVLALAQVWRGSAKTPQRSRVEATQPRKFVLGGARGRRRSRDAVSELEIFRRARDAGDELPPGERAEVVDLLESESSRRRHGEMLWEQSRRALHGPGFSLYLVPSTTGWVCVVLLGKDVNVHCAPALLDVGVIVAFAGSSKEMLIYGARDHVVANVFVEVHSRTLPALLGENTFTIVVPPKLEVVDGAAFLRIRYQDGSEARVDL
jgi:hypothetical protein